jgi:hypothetical protein
MRPRPGETVSPGGIWRVWTWQTKSCQKWDLCKRINRKHSLAVQFDRLHLGSGLQSINVDRPVLINASDVLIAAGKVQEQNAVAHNVRIEAHGLFEHLQVQQFYVASGQTDGKIGALANFWTCVALDVLDFEFPKRDDFV